MASQSEELAIIVRVQDLASRALKSISHELGGLEKNSWAAGRAATRGVGTAIGNIQRLAVAGAGLAVGGGAMAVKWAGDFEAQLNTINTIAMTTPAGLQAIGDGIRDIAKKTGIGLDDLTASYYDLLSAGVKAKDAQSLLNNAVTLGIGGLATTAETVDLLTTAYNAYGLDAAGAAQATDMFAQAVADGKVKASEIAASFSDVASIAKTYKIGIDQIAASYGFLTAQGVPASEAMTEMQRVIISLIKPSKDLDVAQKKLGINFTTEMQTKGLVPALQELRDYSDKTGVPLISLLGRVEAVKYALQTTGPSEKGFLAELDKIHGSAGEAAKQAAERQKGFNFELARLKALAHDAGITVGSALLPEVTGLVSKLNDLATAHQADIASFAKDLAAGFHDAVQWAEKLDIGAIANDLKAAGGFAKGIVEAFMNAPGWLQQAVITGWGLNKLTGGAVVDVGVDLTKGLIGQFAARGASPANPMWVQQVGGVPGAPVAAGAAGSVLGAIAAPVLAVAAVGAVAAIQNSQISDQSDALRAQTRDYVTKASDSQLAQSIDGVRKDLDQMTGIGANAYGQKGTTTDVLNMLIAEQNRRFTAGNTPIGGSERQEAIFGATPEQTKAAEMNARRIEAAENRTGAIVGASGAVIGHQLDALHQSFKTDLGALIHATKPVDVAAAAKKVAAEITKGVGNLATTNHVLATLRAQLSHTHDPATAAVLRAAIAAVEKKIPGREYATAELHKADEVVRSNRSTKEKVAELKTIEQQLKDHGLPNAASRINARINAVKSSVDLLPGRIKNALGGYLYGGTSSGKTGKDDVYHPSSKPSGGSSGGSTSSSDGRSSGTTYDIGSWSVPHTGPAIVHEREMILRPGDADRVRASLSRPGLMPAGAARAIMVNLSVHLTAVMTPKVTFSTRSLQERQKADLRYGKVSAG